MSEKDLTNLELLSTFSHEFRTPLNSIIGFSEILLEEEEREDRKEKLEIIRSGGQLLLSMVENILDFQMALRGRLVSRPVPFSVCDLIKQLEILNGPVAREKGLTFEARCGAGAPEYVAGDKQRLHRVLGHLLENAIKFTSRGSVALEAEYRDGQGVFRVSDTGVGFASRDSKRLFQAFEQGENNLQRSYGGLGIGLTVAKSFVDALGGTLELTSTLGEGTVATVIVPLAATQIPGSGYIERNDGLMVRTWLGNVARDPTLVTAVFDLLRSMPDFYAAVSKAHDTGDYSKEVLELIHDMKGAAGNLHLDELYQAIRGFEEAIRENKDQEERSARFSELRSVYRAIPEDYFTSGGQATGEVRRTVAPATLTPGDRDILSSVLERLERNNRIFDPADLQSLAETLSSSRRELERVLADDIRSAADRYDEDKLEELTRLVRTWLND